MITPERIVRISIGKSCLTRDLVWCECGRGISLSGKWTFCPNCGAKIDQGSYRAAVDLATIAGANLYKANSDHDQLLLRLDAATKRAEAAEGDTARLDWWLDHQWLRLRALEDGFEVRDLNANVPSLKYGDGELLSEGPTKRAAIDAARAEHSKGEADGK